jgi:regulator of replication initiation timing
VQLTFQLQQAANRAASAEHQVQVRDQQVHGLTSENEVLMDAIEDRDEQITDLVRENQGLQIQNQDITESNNAASRQIQQLQV